MLTTLILGVVASFTQGGTSAADDAPEIKGYSVIGRGEGLFAAPAEHCPTPVTQVMGQLTNTVGAIQAGSYNGTILGNGDWYVSTKIPETMPLGVYTLTVRCFDPSYGNFWYAPKQIEITTAPKYVALGDSFSAGEGTFNYDPASEGCHRSPNSYAHYVASARDLGPAALVACSGAMTSDLDTRNMSRVAENAQVDTLQGANEVVTLTIGGNDAGFTRVIEGCAHYPLHLRWGCSTDADLQAEVDERLAALRGEAYVWVDNKYVNDLQYDYTLLGMVAPNAKIFVAGYPHLFGDDIDNYDVNEAAPSGHVCNLSAFVSVDYDDAQWMNSMADALNRQISDAVDAVRAQGVSVYYVSPALFTGHGQCDSHEEWINPIILNSPGDSSLPKPLPESLHPNTTGQAQGYGAAFVSTMNYYD